MDYVKDFTSLDIHILLFDDSFNNLYFYLYLYLFIFIYEILCLTSGMFFMRSSLRLSLIFTSHIDYHHILYH